ncbi:MAG: histidine kinase dimerization/phospho-acceptor domain-containing protein, partial [Thiohalomonadales bacterium]
MRWSISFTHRLLLSVFLSQLLLTVILFGAILFFVEQGYKQQFVDRVRSSTGLYASQLPAIDSKNFKMDAQSSLDELLFDGLAIFITILISDIEPIVSDFNFKDVKFIEDFFFGDHGDSIYFVEIPIGNIHSNTHGILQIGFDESHVEEQIASAYARGFYLISAYLLTTFLVILVVAQMLTKPLRKIRDAAKIIAEGNDHETLSITSNVVEIESLAGDLEFMRSTLLNQKILIEDREKYISSVMNNMANALVVTDILNNIKSINVSAEILFGYKNSDLLNSSVEKLFPIDTWNGYLEIQSQLVAGTVTTRESHEWFGVRSDKHNFPIEVRMSLIKTLDSHLCILNISDITQRKKEQSEIVKAQETAQAANLAKTKFLSSMSHELRTPLNAIIGYSELVKEDFDFLKKGEILTDIDNILNSGKHLLNLINDILDLSKVEA